jgi:hypothetical protein
MESIDSALLSDFWDNCNRIFNAVHNINMMANGFFNDSLGYVGPQLEHNEYVIQYSHNVNSGILAEIRQVNPTFATGS